MDDPDYIPEKKKIKQMMNDNSDVSAGVFILPPEVLQKLGIDLKTIESCADTALDSSSAKDKLVNIDANELPVEVFPKPRTSLSRLAKLKKSYSEDETEETHDGKSSIIETAKLMKESVFLSPTFLLPTQSPQDKNDHEESSPQIHNPSDYNVSNDLGSKAVSLNNKKLDAECATIEFVNEAIRDTSNDIKDNFEVNNDDHLDEAYLSDCSNSNSGSCASIENNAESVRKTGSTEIKKKVHILSEQKVDASKLESILRSPQRDQLVQVQLNSEVIIKDNKKNSLVPTSDKKTPVLHVSDETHSPCQTYGTQGTVDEKFLDKIMLEVTCIDDLDINILDMSVSDLMKHEKCKTPNANSSILNVSPDHQPIGSTENLCDEANDVSLIQLSDLIPVYEIQLPIDMPLPETDVLTELSQKSNPVQITPPPDHQPPTTSTPEHYDSKEIPCNTEIQSLYIMEDIKASLAATTLSNSNEFTEPTEEELTFQEPHMLCTEEIISDVFHEHCTTTLEEKEELYQMKEELTSENSQIGSPKLNKREIELSKEVKPLTNAKNLSTHDTIHKDDKLEKDTGDSSYADNRKNEDKNTNYAKMVDKIALLLTKYAKRTKVQPHSGIQRNLSTNPIQITKHILPKSNVQGVEKPGGSTSNSANNIQDSNTKVFKINEVTKTYIRRHANTHKPSTSTQQVSNNGNIDIQVNKIDDENIAFCICSDYGLMNYFTDMENSYEHIHFWDKPDIVSDAIDIYYDKNYVQYVEDQLKTLPEIKTTAGKSSDCKICWSRIQVYANDEIVPQAIQPVIVEEPDTNIEISIPPAPLTPAFVDVTAQNTDECNDNIEVIIMMEDSDNNITETYSDAKTDLGHIPEITNISELETVSTDDDKSMIDYDQSIVVYKVEPENSNGTALETASTDDDQSMFDSGQTIVVYQVENNPSALQTPNIESQPIENIQNVSPKIKKELSVPIENKSSRRRPYASQNIKTMSKSKKGQRATRRRMIISSSDCDSVDNTGMELDCANDSNVTIKVEAADSQTKPNKKETFPPKSVRRISSNSSDDESLIKLKKSKNNTNLLDETQSETSDDFNSRLCGENFCDISVGTLSGNDSVECQCGVCDIKMKSTYWPEHRWKEHNYLAYKKGEQAPTDFSDPGAVNKYLVEVFNKEGMVCPFCNGNKYPKLFLSHTEICRVVMVGEGVTSPSDEVSQCGACAEFAHSEPEWRFHRREAHGYLAWKVDDTPIDLTNVNDVIAHLEKVSSEETRLICVNCRRDMRRVEYFIEHRLQCVRVQDKLEAPNVNPATVNSVTCAYCMKSVPGKKWKDHNIDNHYNMAWPVGGKTVDWRSGSEACKNLKDYHAKYKGYVCRSCGESRASALGLYAHVLICKKTPQEIEEFSDVCKVCYKTCVGLAMASHSTIHKSLVIDATTVQEKVDPTEKTQIKDSKTRKAATRAKGFIKNSLKNNDDMPPGKYKCSRCDHTADTRSELKSHDCGDFAPESESAEPSSSEHSDDEEEEEEEVADGHTDRRPKRKRKRKQHPNTVQLPIANLDAYIKKACQDVISHHYSTDELFPEWRSYPEWVEDQEAMIYLPSVEQSCKFKVNNGSWRTLKRLQGFSDHVLGCYLGGAPACLSWAPLPEAGAGAGAGGGGGARAEVLAAATLPAPAAPPPAQHQLYSHRSMLQLWNFKRLDTSPIFSLGLLLDTGVVWGMEWCPSGGYSDGRLGLLAVACSDGVGYILAVPEIEDAGHPKYCRIRPVAELRLYKDREKVKYQATAIHWSVQKGHRLVSVGYANGNVAHYDVGSTSPLLRTDEDGLAVFTPYSEECVENTCINGISTFPSMGPSPHTRGLSATSRAVLRATSGGCAGGAGGAEARLTSVAGTAGATLAPLWPTLTPHSLAVAYDASWMTCRRVSAMSSAASCRRCGAAAAAALAPPTLRLFPAHPLQDHPKVDFMAIEMVPLNKKEVVKRNTASELHLQPFTYDEAVLRYGLHIQKIHKSTNYHSEEVSRPDRYPLSLVRQMAFCPSKDHHRNIAVAANAGIVIVTETPFFRNAL